MRRVYEAGGVRLPTVLVLDPDGTQEATGLLTGFVITTSDRTKLYVSGDTLPFAGTIAVRRLRMDMMLVAGLRKLYRHERSESRAHFRDY